MAGPVLPGGPGLAPRTRNILIGCGTILLLSLCLCSGYGAMAFGLPFLQSRQTQAASVAQATRTLQPTFTPVPTSTQLPIRTMTPTRTTTPPTNSTPVAPVPANSTPLANNSVDTNETLNITLDEFGRIARYDDRFPTNGMIWDQSYAPGEIFVANLFAAHDQTFKSQNGCVILYYQAPSSGGRIRFTGWDGMGFELDSNSGIALGQAVAAMRETLVRAHGCKSTGIQFHQVSQYGTAIK